MKSHLLTCLAALAGTSLASPPAERRAPVTTALLNDFRLYAQYAASSFCNEVPGVAITCPGTFCPLVMTSNATTVAAFQGSLTDIRGLVAVDHQKRAIVVSIRGSVSVRNWITDFLFAQVPCSLALGCLVHSGFFAAWKEIEQSVLSGIKTAKTANPSYPLVITGHSLGGAVATIGVGYIRRSGYPIDIYTFGSPRAGNSVFAKFITNQAGNEFRVTHAADPAARLPPIVFNYRHTSPEYWLPNTTPTPADIQVCEGLANVKCNAGTTGFNLTEHSLYFDQVNGCGMLDGTPWRRRDLPDSEIAKQLAEWALEDKEFGATLPKSERRAG